MLFIEQSRMGKTLVNTINFPTSFWTVAVLKEYVVFINFKIDVTLFDFT